MHEAPQRNIGHRVVVRFCSLVPSALAVVILHFRETQATLKVSSLFIKPGGVRPHSSERKLINAPGASGTSALPVKGWDGECRGVAPGW